MSSQRIKGNTKRVRITAEILAELRAHQERTGVGPAALLRNARQECPEGLGSGLIRSWMEGRSKSAQKDHLDYVLNKWRQFSGRSGRVEITPELRSELRRHKARTGIGPSALLRNTRRERPRGLDSRVINQWMEGRAKSASKVHLDYVLQKWRQVRGLERAEIGPKILCELRGHKERTGVGSMALLSNTDPEQRPAGLTPTLINSWIEGRTKSAQKDHLQYALQAWQALPDKK